MELSPITKINNLLQAYPFLLNFFIGKSPHFKNLKNPVMRKTIGKVATLRPSGARLKQGRKKSDMPGSNPNPKT